MGGAAAAAAAAAKRRQEVEEEEMAPYTERDLGEHWEFKILRSATGAFGRHDRLRQILEREGRAGWTLVEKFDDKRIRLKRPASAREADAGLGIDPYRTWVGISEHRLALVVVASIMAVMAAVAMVVTTFLGSLGSR